MCFIIKSYTMPYFKESTPDQVKKLFKTIIQTEKRMKFHSGTDLYYKVQEELTALLSDMLRLDFISLSKLEILKLISLCSSHRPYALHSILIAFSNVHENATTKKVAENQK